MPVTYQMMGYGYDEMLKDDEKDDEIFMVDLIYHTLLLHLIVFMNEKHLVK